MLTAQRKAFILERIKTSGQVSVSLLSQEWKVSEDSIRRDLRDLAAEGLVQRVHGGALPASPALATYENRETLFVDVKERLGKAATSLVKPGQIVAIDGGTTNLRLVRALPRDLPCTIVTHSPIIATELRDHPKVELILIGGRVFRHSQVAVGAEAAEAIARIRTDLFFLGATGVHPQLGATTGDWEDAAVKRVFCGNSAEIVLSASPEKWGAVSPFRIIPANELSVLVLPESTEEASIKPYRDLGIEIIKA